MTFTLHPIGTVRSPYRTVNDAPHQGRGTDAVSEIVILEQYRPGLRDLQHHSHLIVLSWFDRSDRTSLTATPPHTGVEHGVFATRSPNRPNPIGLCVVDLVGCEDGVLTVRGLDSIDRTPVLDIKPYIPEIDCI
jgi:tRNA-Thr(GGU) m(6)t(6)A37 methyltransferase TsaA